ncbi:MAG: hypothetical protein ABR606_03400 [Vicinamibacterales bacterium]
MNRRFVAAKGRDVSSIDREITLSGWQRQTVLAAAALIRDQFGNPPTDAVALAVHDGLLELLDPRRRAVRLDQELSHLPDLALKDTKSERRGGRLRRRAGDRRSADSGPPHGIERRRGQRRSGADRRNVK